jgi:hypothetical protein
MIDLKEILKGKRILRRRLAARPIAEKLRTLDVMRRREIAIRAGRIPQPSETGSVCEGGEPGHAEDIKNFGRES